MSHTEWKGVPIDSTQEWQSAFDVESNGYIVPGNCPVCRQSSLRRYYYLSCVEPREVRGVSFAGRGSVWEWCSSCRSYLHAQALVPKYWSGAILELDHSTLTPIPDVLNQAVSLPP